MVVAGCVVGLLALLCYPLLEWLRRPPAIHHSKTNVLMLTLCTLRADHLGSYGYERNISPNLDRLAAEGYRFERVLAQAPWTKSSIAAIITGMYPRSLQIEDPENKENYRRLHDDFTTIAEIMQANDYYTIGITANPNTAAVFGMAQGYDHYEDPGQLWQDDFRKQSMWGSDKVAGRLLEQLRTRPPGEKFFAHLVLIDAHTPWTHKRELEPGDDFELPSVLGPIDEYDLQISFLDRNIGSLLQELEELGYGEDLLLVVNADHGEGFREQSWLDVGHGRTIYNSTIWVPWIVHHPRLGAAGASREAMVQQVDMVPTILELLAIDESRAIQGLYAKAGTSRAADILGSGVSPPLEHGFVRTRFLRADKGAVVTPEYKLIQNFDSRRKLQARKRKGEYYFPPRLELYRYRADPLEQQDLHAGEAAIVRRLQASYLEWDRAYLPLVEGVAVRVSREETLRQLEALKALGYVEEPTN
jgi:arylsulfatase A-like enzyme